MKKRTSIWLVTAASLVVVGCIIFGGVMTMLEWDFAKLSTAKYETNEYESSDKYNNIAIVTDTADIVFMPSEDGKNAVVCYEQENVKHRVAVKDGTLVIEVADARTWYQHIGISFGTPQITVYMPQGDYGTLSVKSSTGNVAIPKQFTFESITISQSTGHVTSGASVSDTIKIKTTTGHICVENITAGALDLSASTGRITVSGVTCKENVNVHVSTGKTDLTDVSCKHLTSSGSTGNILLQHVTATETFTIKRSTGDVTFESADAAEIFVQTDTGDVTGSFLTDKVFITQTDTGRVDVPKAVTGGRCEITTDTGDIRIKIQ